MIALGEDVARSMRDVSAFVFLADLGVAGSVRVVDMLSSESLPKWLYIVEGSSFGLAILGLAGAVLGIRVLAGPHDNHDSAG